MTNTTMAAGDCCIQQDHFLPTITWWVLVGAGGWCQGCVRVGCGLVGLWVGWTAGLLGCGLGGLWVELVVGWVGWVWCRVGMIGLSGLVLACCVLDV